MRFSELGLRENAAFEAYHRRVKSLLPYDLWAANFIFFLIGSAIYLANVLSYFGFDIKVPNLVMWIGTISLWLSMVFSFIIWFVSRRDRIFLQSLKKYTNRFGGGEIPQAVQDSCWSYSNRNCYKFWKRLAS